jgi:hypothetical protein
VAKAREASRLATILYERVAQDFLLTILDSERSKH